MEKIAMKIDSFPVKRGASVLFWRAAQVFLKTIYYGAVLRFYFIAVYF